MTQLKVKDVGNMSLLTHTCRCGELCIDGFLHQLNVKVDNEKRIAVVDCPCRKCGLIYQRKLRLTAGRAIRPRLLPWTDWFWCYCHWVPNKMMRKAIAMILFLERVLPI